jgi:hypothetical protein
MGCNIQPSRNDNFISHCSTSYAATSYEVDYSVAGAASGATFAWTPPAGKTIVSGCTSAYSYCVVSTYAGGDMHLVGSVVVTESGTNYNFSATAFIPAICGNEVC